MSSRLSQKRLIAEPRIDSDGAHIVIRRGKAFEIRVKPSEAIDLANQLVDIAEGANDDPPAVH